jgi:protein ImuA
MIPCATLPIETFSMTQARRANVRAQQTGITLSEVFAETGAEAAATGFVVAQLGHGAAPVLWVQDRAAQRETGRPFLAGLGLHRPLILMQLFRPVDVLIAVEEGLRCKALAAVVAEIRGNPPVLNFTAMKRLATRAEATGLSCWLIRQAATVDLSAARDRWRIGSLPSAVNPDDPHAPGDPRWRAELFRSRDRRPGIWVAQHERAADRVHLSAAVRDGALAEDATADWQRTAG